MFKASLGRKITILFLLIGLLPLGILSILFYIQMRASLKQTVANNLITLASEVGTEIERTIFTGVANIKTLSQNPALMSEKTTNEEKLVEMRKIQDFYMIFEDITLIDLKGNVIVSTTYNYRGAWKTKNWYQQAKEGLTVVSRPHILISPYKVAMVTTAPVVDRDNQIIAVVAGQINMERVWEIADRVKIGKTGFVFLINKEGNFVAHPDKSRIFTKMTPGALLEKILIEPSGSLEYQTKEMESRVCGFMRLGGYLDYKGQEWQIGVTQDVNEAYRIIKTAQNTVSFIASSFFIIIILVSVRLTQDIVRPVRTLVTGTKKIAEGDLGHQIKIRSEDEIGQLAAAFNLMTKELKKSMEKIADYSRTLEQKVEERTGQLKEAYNKLRGAQERLIQAEKLSAVGQLASGVAHEVKNPLAIILQSADYLENKIPPEQKEVLQMIKDNITRADNIIHTLIDFSRVTKLNIIPESINSILESSLTLINYRIKSEEIKIVKELGKDLPNALVDRNKMEQVFVNIFLNAIQAMPQGGNLFIRTYLTKFDKSGNDTKRRNGDYYFNLGEEAVVVEIEDTGVGIPKGSLRRVFDPFFTTKGPGGGVGLGLSVTKNIITMHKGLIEIKSKIGEGTTVTLTLKTEGEEVGEV